jgi:hypothetical protein
MDLVGLTEEFEYEYTEGMLLLIGSEDEGVVL